jgi:nucleoside-diphosphate-sugar epimerase
LTLPGLPKPIYLTHGYFAAFDNISRCPLPPGRKLAIPSGFFSKDDSMLTVTPFFHVMGFAAFIQAIFHGTPFAIPPLKPLSGELIINTIKTLKPRAATLPPSLIENICSTKMGMDCLNRLDYLFFGGAPLAFDIGEALRERVRLISLIGSTEMGVILSMAPEESADWAYFDWAPNSNVYMDPVDSDLHELVIRRGKDRKVHGIFHTFPDLREYRSQDLFRRHPNKANLWRYAGRLDDVIVLSNGEKFNPIATEKAIEAHPLVSKAIVVGQARFQSAMLIEPNWDLWTDNEHTVEDFLGEVWPLVERANEMVPAYGRVMFNRIGLASKAKPFKVTAKGSTQRRQVNNDYHIEIDSLYAKEPITKLEFPKTPTISSITCYIQQVVHGQLNSPAIDDWADLYAAGLDSLQTASIANMLNKAINRREPNSEELITAQMVYDHPTISALSHFINSFLHGSRVEMAISRTTKINDVLKTYIYAPPEQKALSISRDTCRKHVVLLTGSTGSLGTYILNVLLGDPSVAKIYCLNRSERAEENQMKSHLKRGLRVWHLNDDRVEFVHAVFGENHLGLPDTTYYRLLNAVDIIVHNAWDVNFNRSLTSFQPLIKGAYDLFDISRRGRFRPHFFFVSSISTIQNWNISMGGRSAPEDLIKSPDAVAHQGYAESKHVVERLCYHMSSVARVPTTILRVGQIAGPSLSMGNWNRSEWLPALVETSRSLGKIPNHLGNANNIDWIPVVSHSLG